MKSTANDAIESVKNREGMSKPNSLCTCSTIVLWKRIFHLCAATDGISSGSEVVNPPSDDDVEVVEQRVTIYQWMDAGG